MTPANDQRNAVAVRWHRIRDVQQHDEIFTASLNNKQSSYHNLNNLALLKADRFVSLYLTQGWPTCDAQRVKVNKGRH